MKSWFTIKNEAGKPAAEIDIFDEIGLWGVTPKDFAQQLASIPSDRDITLRINSPGGSIFDGFAIFNMLAARRERVTASVIGLAASMATIVMLAAKRVTAAENSTLMIHRPAGGAWGESKDMREMADLLDKLEGQLVSAYVAKTGKSEADVKAAMAATTWFTAAEAKEWGLVDEVTAAMQAAATFDLTRFGELPKNISGGRSASTNQPTQNEMKNLLKALVEAKLIASADVTDEVAALQFEAAFAAQANTIKAQSEQIADLDTKLKAANETIAANAKAAAQVAVDAAVKAGKIKDDEEARAKWADWYVKDSAGTQAMLDAIADPKTPRGAAPVVTGALTTTATNDRPSTESVWAKQFNR